MSDQSERAIATRGVAFALGAYGFWGFVVLFYRALGQVPAVELVAHRGVWSVVFVTIVVVARGSWPRLVAVFKSPVLLKKLALTSALVSINWGVFIWAIGEQRVVEVSFGYYINPLVSVALGVVLLGEKLNRAQGAAIAIAAVAVAIFGLTFGVLPWLPLVLAFSFGFYGYLRKSIPVGPAVGLLVEVLVLSIPALAYLAWLGVQGQAHWSATPTTPLLLVLSGPATAIPLILFAAGAQRLRLATLGMLQYVAPSIHLGVAVFVFGEAVSPVQILTFGLIWVALGVYSLDAVRADKA